MDYLEMIRDIECFLFRRYGIKNISITTEDTYTSFQDDFEKRISNNRTMGVRTFHITGEAVIERG